jgi:hypothetical protein
MPDFVALHCIALHCILSSSGTYFIGMFMHARSDGPPGQWQGTSAVLGILCVVFISWKRRVHTCTYVGCRVDGDFRHVSAFFPM